MKKNNKGFTLIELLGVIVILIAIIALVIPKILGNARSKKSTVATIDNDIVMSAVKLYVEEHKKDYPEINGNTYCISTNGTEWNEIKSKYLAKNTSYNDNSMIKVVYNGKYVFSNDNSCSPVSTDPQHCSPESACRSCLVEKKYINGNYQYSSRIIANVNNTNIQNIFQLNEILYVNDDNSCVYQAILKAAQDYVASKPDYFINNENINYCISVSELESKGLLKTGLIYNGESVSNKSIKAKYNLQANQFTYSGLSNSCTASTICLVKQEYINQKKRYSPEIVNENTNINLQNETLYIDNNDECTYQAILKAAQDYVNAHPSDYRRINGNEYCLPLKTLVDSEYLKSPVNYNSQNITNTYSVQVSVQSGNYSYNLTSKNSCQEKLECGTYIDLAPSLTPVKYNGSNWVVTYENDPDWFDYSNQKWANAVILKNAKSVGETVIVDGSENEIDAYAMFVWIPRFSIAMRRVDRSNNQNVSYNYGIGIPNLNYGSDPSVWNSNHSVGKIDAKCVSKTQKDNGSVYYSENESKDSKWFTLPAFTLGDMELNGIWMSKFMTSSSDNNYQSNSITTTSQNLLRALPNRQILKMTNITGKAFFISSYGALGVNNSSAESAENIHLIRNSEWASLMYFSFSDYGKFGNSSYAGKNKYIYANKPLNAYSGLTGVSCGKYIQKGKSECDKNDSTGKYNYNVDNGVGASSTGNVTGVYDIVHSGNIPYLLTAAKHAQNTSLSAYEPYIDKLTSKSQLGQATDFYFQSYPFFEDKTDFLDRYISNIGNGVYDYSFFDYHTNSYLDDGKYKNGLYASRLALTYWKSS